MSVEILFPILFGTLFVVAAGSFVARIVKYGGFKAAMFGAPITRTVGEVLGKGPKLFTLTVRVHSLGEGSSAGQVGLEIVAKGFAGYQMMPVTLSATDAARLAALIQAAATPGQHVVPPTGGGAA